jgi:hypothetical protein
MSYLRRPLAYAGLVMLFTFYLAFGAVCIGQTGTKALYLDGIAGASSRWGAGWIDFVKPMDFETNDRLRLKVGGTAEKIIVRLLEEGQFPDEPAGIVGYSIEVPKDRIVEIVLHKAHKKIVQISVHGGPKAWHFPLGADNGPATLVSAEFIRP